MLHFSKIIFRLYFRNIFSNISRINFFTNIPKIIFLDCLKIASKHFHCKYTLPNSRIIFSFLLQETFLFLKNILLHIVFSVFLSYNIRRCRKKKGEYQVTNNTSSYFLIPFSMTNHFVVFRFQTSYQHF